MPRAARNRSTLTLTHPQAAGIDIGRAAHYVAVPRKAPKFNRCDLMFKRCGVDLTRIDGFDITTALTVISEGRTDLLSAADITDSIVQRLIAATSVSFRAELLCLV